MQRGSNRQNCERQAPNCLGKNTLAPSRPPPLMRLSSFPRAAALVSGSALALCHARVPLAAVGLVVPADQDRLARLRSLRFRVRAHGDRGGGSGLDRAGRALALAARAASLALADRDGRAGPGRAVPAAGRRRAADDQRRSRPDDGRRADLDDPDLARAQPGRGLERARRDGPRARPRRRRDLRSVRPSRRSFIRTRPGAARSASSPPSAMPPAR